MFLRKLVQIFFLIRCVRNNFIIICTYINTEGKTPLYYIIHKLQVDYIGM